LESDEIQQRLFTVKRYTYHRVLVTNLELSAAAVWRFYCDRACQELLLREFKDSYAMAKIPTPQFLGRWGLHEDPSVGLRFGFGLPVSLLAQANPALEYRHLAPRALVVARSVGQTTKPKLPPKAGLVARAIPNRLTTLIIDVLMVNFSCGADLLSAAIHPRVRRSLSGLGDVGRTVHCRRRDYVGNIFSECRGHDHSGIVSQNIKQIADGPSITDLDIVSTITSWPAIFRSHPCPCRLP
jgi:hypothetical protein